MYCSGRSFAMDPVKQFLSDNHVRVSPGWIIKSLESAPKNKTMSEVKQFIFRHWLNCDIHITGLGSLPTGLCHQKHIVLQGCHTLQVDGVRDVSQSAVSQLATLLGKDTNEDIKVTAEPQDYLPKPRRMLALNLTDGKERFMGIEFSPIPTLTMDLAPGLKVVISGPIDCYCGVLHLTRANIRILGGSVEDSKNVFFKERLLRKACGLPEEPTRENPITQHNNPIGPSGDRRPRTDEGNRQNNIDDWMEDDFVDLDSDLIDEMERNNSRLNNSTNNLARGVTTDPGFIRNSDDWFEDFNELEPDPEILAELERTAHFGYDIETKYSSPSKSKQARIDKPTTSATVSPSKIKQKPERSARSRLSSSRLAAPKTPQKVGRSPVKPTASCISIKTPLSKVTPLSRFDSKVSNTDEPTASYSSIQKPLSKVTPSSRFDPKVSYSSSFLQMNKSEQQSVFSYLIQPRNVVQLPNRRLTVKGFIVTILPPLRIDPVNGYCIKVLVSDGTATEEAELSETVLAKLMGFDSNEFNSKWRLMKGNPEVKREIQDALKMCTTKLVNLSCLFTLQFHANQTTKVIDFQELNAEHAKLLLIKRFNNEK